MAERRYYWLKLKEDFFEEKHIRALRRLPDGDALAIIYLKMQLKSLKTEGIIRYDRIMPSVAEELALLLDEDVNKVQLALQAIINMGVAELWDDETLYLSAMQSLVGSETSAAARVRRHREQKALQCNADVTVGNVEIEKEREIEKSKSRKADKPPATPQKELPLEVIDFGNLSPNVVSAVERWLQYKKERRETYKPTGLKALISQITNNVARFGEGAVIDLIDECMASNWRGIIFERLKEKPQQRQQQQKSGGDRLLEMIRGGVFDE